MSGPSFPKDARKAVRRALKAGWSLDATGRHNKLRGPSGQVIVFSVSASDGNAAKNIVRDIEKALAAS